MNEEPPVPQTVPDAVQLAWRAEELLSRHRTDAARAVLEDALRSHPGDSRLLLAMARAEYLDDDYAGARANLSRVLVADPEDADARLLLHLVASEEGSFPEAEELILGLLRGSPAHALYYALYSRLMLKALDFDKAGQLADEALRLAPQDPAALRARALCDLVEGRQGRDAAALVQLIVNDPEDVHTLRLIVVSLLEQNRIRQAGKLARELLRASPSDLWLLNIVKQTHYATHWSLLPLWPVQRFGWGGSVATWGLAVLSFRLADHWAPQYTSAIVTVWLAYVVYSWVWPGALRRILGAKA